jgi:hypothetical protein
MWDEENRVALQVLITDSSVRLYGNRAFFIYFKSEIDRLIECPADGHCEFQTISLAADLPRGLNARPYYKILKMGPNENDISTAQGINNDAFDVVFMTLENEKFD